MAERVLFPELTTISPDVFEKALFDRARIDSKTAYFAKSTDNMLQEYNQKLREKDYVLSRRQLKNLNMIDARPLLLLGDNPIEIHSRFFRKDLEKDLEFAKKNDFYSMIPCFSEGVIQCNTDRYIYFKILDVDAENSCFTLELRDYIAYKYCWTYGVGGTVKFCDSGKIYDGVNAKTYNDQFQTMSDVYNILSKEELGWSDKQIEFWNRTVVTLADRANKELEEKYNTNQFKELVKIYLLIITKINRKLAECKVSRPVGEKRNTGNKKKIVVSDSSSKKHIRMVGNMPIKSEKPPKLPTYESVIHYSTPSWTTRGYVRTYKSGKKVYIKETVHKRKCMQELGENEIATVIRFRKDRKEKEDAISTKS